jgi:hypothetical protein
VVRTYAPRTQTPILRVPLTRDHLSAISGITLDDRLFLLVQERPLRGPDVVASYATYCAISPASCW